MDDVLAMSIDGAHTMYSWGLGSNGEGAPVNVVGDDGFTREPKDVEQFMFLH